MTTLAADALALLVRLDTADGGAGVWVDRADFGIEEALAVLVAEGDLVTQHPALPSHWHVTVLPRGRTLAGAQRAIA